MLKSKLYLSLMWHVGAVVSTATSQQEGCGLELALACDKTPTIMSEYFSDHGKDKLPLTVRNLR